MYKVKWYGVSGVEKEMDFPTLDLALKFSQSLGTFVTITDGETEIVGKFGVDSVIDNLLPDGNNYNWYKRRKPDAKKDREAQWV